MKMDPSYETHAQLLGNNGYLCEAQRAHIGDGGCIMCSVCRAETIGMRKYFSPLLVCQTSFFYDFLKTHSYGKSSKFYDSRVTFFRPSKPP